MGPHGAAPVQKIKTSPGKGKGEKKGMGRLLFAALALGVGPTTHWLLALALALPSKYPRSLLIYLLLLLIPPAQ
jgi:hypothetical protein